MHPTFSSLFSGWPVDYASSLQSIEAERSNFPSNACLKPSSLTNPANANPNRDLHGKIVRLTTNLDEGNGGPEFYALLLRLLNGLLDPHDDGSARFAMLPYCGEANAPLAIVRHSSVAYSATAAAVDRAVSHRS